LQTLPIPNVMWEDVFSGFHNGASWVKSVTSYVGYGGHTVKV